ncbi:MAG: serine/threonine protein kinase [Planctomycetaceae bacterium]
MAAPDHQRVRELFHDAVALPADRRPAFLDRACADDAELRAAVDRLLKHHHPDTLLLEDDRKAAAAVDSGLTAPISAEPVSLEVTSAATESDDVDFGKASRGADTQPVPMWTSHFGDTAPTSYSGTALGTLQRQSQLLPGIRRERRWLVTGSGLCLLLLMLLGWWVHIAIHQSIAGSLSRTLHALLEQQAFAIETWLAAEESLVESWTRTPDVIQAVVELDQIGRTAADVQAALATSEAAEQLRQALKTVSADAGPFQYAVWNREGRLIADSSPASAALLGNDATEFGASLLARVFRGETVVWLPSRAGYVTQGFELQGGMQKAYLAIVAPVYSTNRERPVAAILMSDQSRQNRLERLLEKSRFGDTSEVYAFGDDGYLLTESRFLDQLQQVNLVQKGKDAFSAQVVRVADPGGNLLNGFRPGLEPVEWPLTRAATAAVAGLSGSDFDGYRDYRGVRVVGAWTWLPKYRFAIVAEVDYADAYGPLTPLHRAFGIVFAALMFAAVFAVAASMALLKVRQNAGDATRVGPYTLKSLLGEGGFARVYLASHALLKRPTAVKILKPDQINEKNLVRFEREVQLASSLTHPNTIGIYDYGSTADGSFYYAMEYIKGPSLQELVEQDGPQIPERVVWILIQICRSLREAHARGLIHRDIKPQNIMLCRRGGECDFVKVLDFGLARSLETEQQRVTETKLLIGTPLYIAPERILDPGCMDPRSDIYSLGILGYVLLTGREPFEAAGSLDALAQAINRPARHPSEHSPRPVPSELDRLIRDCHARVITDRPQSVQEVLDRLDAIPFAEKWTTDRAAVWWEAHLTTAALAPSDLSVARDSAQTVLLPSQADTGEIPQ